MEDLLIFNTVYDVKWNEKIRKELYLGYQKNTKSTKPHIIAMKGIRDPIIVAYGFDEFSFKEDKLILFDPYLQKLSSLEEAYVRNLIPKNGLPWLR